MGVCRHPLLLRLIIEPGVRGGRKEREKSSKLLATADCTAAAAAGTAFRSDDDIARHTMPGITEMATAMWQAMLREQSLSVPIIQVADSQKRQSNHVIRLSNT